MRWVAVAPVFGHQRLSGHAGLDEAPSHGAGACASMPQLKMPGSSTSSVVGRCGSSRSGGIVTRKGRIMRRRHTPPATVGKRWQRVRGQHQPRGRSRVDTREVFAVEIHAVAGDEGFAGEPSATRPIAPTSGTRLASFGGERHPTRATVIPSLAAKICGLTCHQPGPSLVWIRCHSW